MRDALRTCTVRVTSSMHRSPAVPSKIIHPRAMRIPSLLVVTSFVGAAFLSAEPVMVPKIKGDWWTIATQPDLGPHTSPRQQPVDFAIWQAADGTWQLWSCIRYTGDPDNTRLLYRWEGTQLTDTNWTPKGIAQRADPSEGEYPGRIGAPFVVREDDRYVMVYHSAGFHAQTSEDGKTFTRWRRPGDDPRLFAAREGTYGRDIMLVRINDRWHGYYGGSTPDPTGQHVASIFVRVAQEESLFGPWGEQFVVNSEGLAGSSGYNAECPWVIERHGWYYLFRTEIYGANNRTHIYRSRSPYKFGIDSDAYHVATLPVAAPEIIEYQGEDYIVALNPGLDGIRIVRLEWVPKESPDEGKGDEATATDDAARPLRPTLAPESLLLAEIDRTTQSAPDRGFGSHSVYVDADGVWTVLADVGGEWRRWRSPDFFADRMWDAAPAIDANGSPAAPVVVQNDDAWWLLAVRPSADSTQVQQLTARRSSDGRAWAVESDPVVWFSGPGQVRDLYVVRLGEQWYCYYTGEYDEARRHAAILVRTSPDLVTWSAPQVAHEDVLADAATALRSHASPVVVYRSGYYYLFRQTAAGTVHVYRSSTPENFGRGQMDNKMIATLPLTAPELVVGPDGYDYVTSTSADGSRIQMHRLLWEADKPAW